MKIAIDCRLWYQGGVGRYIRNLIFFLSKFDQQNEYFLYFYKQSPFKSNKNFSVRITQAKWHSLAEQWQFNNELNQGKYDLVHFPYFSHPILYKHSFIITIHDLTIKHFATGQATTKILPWYYLKRLGYLQVLSHAVNRSEHILVPSLAVQQDIIKHFGKVSKPITVTYEGLGTELVQAKAKAVSLPSNHFLLYVGNFYPHKNVSLLLKALTKIRDKSLRLVLVGPNDFFSRRLRSQVDQRNLKNRVIFRLAMSESELAWLYQHAQALVLPSLYEGFGLPVIEAAYFHCPQILSKLAVFQEIAPPTTSFFQPWSLSDLTTKLNNLPLRKEKIVSSDYFDRFSFAKMARKTLAVYKQFQ